MLVYLADASTQIYVTLDKSNTLINNKNKNDSDNDNQAKMITKVTLITFFVVFASANMTKVNVPCLNAANGTINVACG